jgi:RNA polymerase sigma-70 factor (ECF subfamily)
VANPSTACPRFWPTVETETAQANGRSGDILHRGGRATTFMTIAATHHGIHQVKWVFNPNKIAALLHSRSRSSRRSHSRSHSHEAAFGT